MSIPLVQNNEKDSINTSIIAIKRQIERINALLGLSNSEEIDTSVFATKTELEDAVTQVETDLAPVDEVTADNMQSVTSNAVANCFEWEDISNKVTFTKDVSGSTSTAFNVILQHCYKSKNFLKLGFTIQPTEEIPAPSGNGNLRFFMDIDGIIPQSSLSTVGLATYVGNRYHLGTFAFYSDTPNRWRATIRYTGIVYTSTFSYYFVIPI